MLFGVDLPKNFGVNYVPDFFGEGNDVLRMLTIICATAGVEIKTEPVNSCSLRAARIQRSVLMFYVDMHVYIYIYVYIDTQI